MSSSETSSDEEFQKKGKGSLTYPAKANTLKKGQYVVIKGFPCKIVEVTTSKTGKHGHAKVHCTAVDIFTEKKYIEHTPGSHNVEKPFVTKMEYDLVDLNKGDGTVQYLDDETNEINEELRIDPKSEMFEKMLAGLDNGDNVIISVTNAMGRSEVTGHRRE